ncbi:hypothetical protein GUJ93_ZPchr0013g34201 [Zizania palustris]|uniref:U-box domain-containing protein n=1 Tax=Zizania palustris TaxID=103762 RepID=A0A8J6BY04_ZIZPA|nr:hypothetical protein GUJ93_ZPchr0013g34201 [Zizania palustris]
MALLVRRARKAVEKATAEAPAPLKQGGGELAIPAHFRCPISLDLMRDPVTAPTGITYDREGIEAWLDRGRAVCPVTHAPLRQEDLVPNHAIRRVIQDWCVANRSRGVERIPTPKIPVTPVQASELLFDVVAESARRDGGAARCARAAARVRALARDSERNRRCFVSVGTGRALAAAFECLAAAGATAVLEDVLAALVCMMPLDEEAARVFASPSSLGSLVAIAKHGSLAGRLNAVLVIKEVVSRDGGLGDLGAKVDEIVDALVRVIKAPICPQATKAAMVATYHLANSDERVAAMVASTGLVQVLVEALVGADKSASEKALAVIDAVLASDEGRASARDHALVMPVLVKKMFRVSDVATELAVSAMWRLGCKGSDEEAATTGCLVEALRVGAFQKLLLLLQVGCRDATKDKATELLKMLNKHKGLGECVDAVDFRGLNRLT